MGYFDHSTYIIDHPDVDILENNVPLMNQCLDKLDGFVCERADEKLRYELDSIVDYYVKCAKTYDLPPLQKYFTRPIIGFSGLIKSVVNYFKETPFTLPSLPRNNVCICSGCNIKNEYAESNQVDESYICYNCRG